MMNGIAFITSWTSGRIKGLQSGQVQKYGYAFVSGVIIITIAFVYYWYN
jgi:hypothetical protein